MFNKYRVSQNTLFFSLPFSQIDFIFRNCIFSYCLLGHKPNIIDDINKIIKTEEEKEGSKNMLKKQAGAELCQGQIKLGLAIK